MRLLRFAICLCVYAMAFPQIAAAGTTTIYVPADEQTIQQAIDVAVNGDEIVVSPGTYNESIDLLGKAITVRSEMGAPATTIDASGLNTAAVVFQSGETTSTILEGFTLTGGIGVQVGSERRGGAIWMMMSDPTIRRCVFTGNTADDGGAMYGSISDPSILNCLFYDNSATEGGAVATNLGTPILKNCTFTQNSAATGSQIHSTQGTTRLINCIVWDTDPDLLAGTANYVITYSDIRGGWPGAGNIDANPQFVDASSNNFRLKTTSPCVDAGDSSAISAEIFTDIDNNQRGINEPSVTDTGIPIFGLTVDMGAYELQASANEQCPHDINQDQQIDVTDLLDLLARWGECE